MFWIVQHVLIMRFFPVNDYTPEDTVNFGVAASAVKHTIHGDGNITDDVSLIRHVMEMNFDIKR